MRKSAALLAAVLLFVVLFIVIRQRVPKPARSAQRALPVMTDFDAKPVDLSRYAGEVVVVNFWAVWCTPCRAEIPQFVELQNRQRARGLQIVGISMDDPESVLRKFYSESKMNYPVVIGDQKLAEAYGGVLGLPTTVLIGRDQRVRDKLVGTTDFKVLEEKIGALLNEK
jgi:cytochrome c biogenesis protein CcmG/thiol:disulfide interchange protein DsbE